MLNETAVEFGIRDENDWGENYWVSNLSTANLRNDFTITGLSSVPGAVTSSAGSWTSLEDLISHGKIGVNTTQTSHYDCTLWQITGNLSASMSALNATVMINSAKWNTVTNKLDSTAFSTVSGNFLTAHQSLTGSANWDSTYNTVSNNSASCAGGAGGDMFVSGLAYTTGGEISSYSGSAFASTDPTYELSAGDGISLTTGASALTIGCTLTLATGSI